MGRAIGVMLAAAFIAACGPGAGNRDSPKDSTPRVARAVTPQESSSLPPGVLQNCLSGGTADESRACEQHRARVRELWLIQGSYYALLEIAETTLTPGLGSMRREDVLDLLGSDRIDRDYPRSREDGFLVWSSNRSATVDSYLIVRFDRRGVAQSFEWVSE